MLKSNILFKGLSNIVELLETWRFSSGSSLVYDEKAGEYKEVVKNTTAKPLDLRRLRKFFIKHEKDLFDNPCVLFNSSTFCYAVNDQDFHWVVCHEFEKRGWQVEDVYLGNPMRHDEKYLLINQGFAGKQRLMPFFNRQNNDDLILAIQTAGVVRGRNGFRKDKDY